MSSLIPVSFRYSAANALSTCLKAPPLTTLISAAWASCDMASDSAVARTAGNSFIRSPSPLEQAHELGLGQRVEMQVKADDRRRSVGLDVELVGLHREHREQIAMRMVTLGRARTAIAGRAEIGARLQGLRGQLAGRAARALGKLAYIRRDVDHQPMPEARTSRRIGIVAGHGEAFRFRRRARPFQLRRFVAPSAAEAEIGREDEILRHVVAVLETGAGDRERHCRLLSAPRSRR